MSFLVNEKPHRLATFKFAHANVTDEWTKPDKNLDSFPATGKCICPSNVLLSGHLSNCPFNGS